MENKIKRIIEQLKSMNFMLRQAAVPLCMQQAAL